MVHGAEGQTPCFIIFLDIGMKNICILLYLVIQSFFPVKPEPFLRDYIAIFRREYKIEPSRVIVMDTWSDSTHFYYEGKVIDGNEDISDEDLVVSPRRIQSPLFSTTNEIHSKDIGLFEDYDDQASFLICCHQDSTICNILSYENSYFNGIPALLQIEEKYGLQTNKDDPDIKDSYPFLIDNPAQYDGNLLELSKMISDTLIEKGISNGQKQRITIVLDIDQEGNAVFKELRKSGVPLYNNQPIVDCIVSIIQTLNFIPGSHRGLSVHSSVGIPIFIGE